MDEDDKSLYYGVEDLGDGQCLILPRYKLNQIKYNLDIYVFIKYAE
jgi:hypothetical protein